ncbi:unnamed protein product [Echinostoma caproni]|uniref:Uncharacterized protein n=1 Tax=Echinostoma caproni TaxID=27848 RepID=A0A183A5L9_9TREM|nr:unnamed protein product [Echinostoma caproni]
MGIHNGFVQTINCRNCVKVNPEAVSLLASGFLYPTDVDLPSEILRPHLARGIAPRDRATYPPDANSLTYLIPNSADSPDLDESSQTNELPPDWEHITTEERKALDEARQSSRKLPLRMYTPGRPHPNEVFFFKETDKRELLDELRSEVPSFGGSFGRLPEPYDSLSRKWFSDHRRRQPRPRVQQPPKRWR